MSNPINSNRKPLGKTVFKSQNKMLLRHYDTISIDCKFLLLCVGIVNTCFKNYVRIQQIDM